MEDKQIVELFFCRDEDAIRETDAKYGIKLLRTAMKILVSCEDAEECKNDTYLKAWNAIPPSSPTFLFAYLAKICRRLSLNRIDWQNAKKRGAEVISLTDELIACIPADNADVTWNDEETGQLISRFLEQQPKEKRQMFVRRYWYMDSNPEIAKRFGRSVTSVETELFRMRKKLKNYLEKEGIWL